MKEFKVVIPEESFMLMRYIREEMPGVAIFNAGLLDFEPQEVFGFHLGLTVWYDNPDGEGMPSEVEMLVLNNFEDELSSNIAGPDGERPNALLVGRTTWNGTRDLFWRVFDPEPVHHYLQELIHLESHPREFNYEMEPDAEWKLSQWQLDACRQALNASEE
jgi:hypothetical protein